MLGSFGRARDECLGLCSSRLPVGVRVAVYGVVNSVLLVGLHPAVAVDVVGLVEWLGLVVPITVFSPFDVGVQVLFRDVLGLVKQLVAISVP